MIEIKKVSFAYTDGLVLQDIDLTIALGEMVGLLGPNGCGKTTLLKLCWGLLQPKQGEVRLNGANIGQLSRKKIAQQIAIVPQHFHIPFAFTVREVVLLGRTPFLRPFAEEKPEHRKAVEEALELMDISHLQDRFFNELSGGERQKVILAMALAQQPKLLLLDEPTAHLDIHHQIDILAKVKFLHHRGLTVLAAIHDINLAALYFERLVLLKQGRLFAQGTPSQILTEEVIEQVFSARVKVEPHPTQPTSHIIVIP